MQVTGPTRAGEADDAALAVWGIPTPAGFAARVARLVRPLEAVDLLQPELDGDTLVALWRACHRNHRLVDDLARAAIMHRFAAAFTRVEGLSRALAANRLGVDRTFAEVDFQAGTACYRLSGVLIRDQSSAAAGHRVLEDCLAAFRRAVPRSTLMKEPQRLVLHGQAGVAALRLARKEEAPSALLEQAVEHLAAAEDLGDETEQHFAYLSEAWLSLDALGTRPGALAGARTALARAGKNGHDSPGLRLNAADVATRGAFQIMASDPVRALNGFRAASVHATRGMALPGQESTRAILRGRRGQARFQMWLLQPDSAVLDDAVDDLRSYKRTPFVAISLIQALMADAQERRSEKDWAGVRDAVAEALDYQQATGAADHRLARRMILARHEADAAIALSDADDASLRDSLEAILALTPGRDLPVVVVAYGLRHLAKAGQDVVDQCRRAAAACREVAENIDMPTSARAFAASHGGGLLWLVAGSRDSLDDVATAHHLYRLAVDAIGPSAEPELLSCAGASTSRLARLTLAEGEQADERALGLFCDAREYLVRTLEVLNTMQRQVSVDERVARGRLADCSVRIHAITRENADAERALHDLDAARAAGEDGPEIEGLHADVLLRRGRARRERADLREGMARKEAAVAAGAPPSRENRSACAAAALMLADLGDREQLEAAARFAVGALAADSEWPWPWLQLAEVARRVSRSGAARPQTPGTDAAPIALALGGAAETLTMRAAELAASTAEFATSTLGGRSGTYVLADPHRLLSSSLVLKPTQRDDADRERELTEALRGAFRDAGLTSVRVPIPVGVVDRGSSVIYVMRRAAGRQLGALTLDALAGRREPPLREYRLAIDALALFHAHTLANARPRRGAQSAWRRWLRMGMAEDLRRDRASEPAIAEIDEMLAAAAPPRPLLLPRRDAHPENWLVDERGNVVLLDVESRAPQAIVYEVVQLLDDYPLIAPDVDGMEERLQLVGRYVDALRRHGVPIEEPHDGRTGYEVYAIRRAVFALTHRPGGVRSQYTSSSSLRAWSLRQAHAVALLRHLAAAAHSPDSRRLAGAVLAITAST